MSSSSFRFIVRTGPNPGMVFDLTKDATVIGRDVTNDIVIGDTEVSRQHCRATRTPGGYVLEDLGSTNGTFVNGERLMAPRVLNPGDLVGFGETVTITFDALAPEAAATVARPAAAPAPAAPAPAPAAPAPAPAVPAPAPVQPSRIPKNRLPLALAGGGCLVLLLICGAVLWVLPCDWWQVLLTPLKFLNFQFPPCPPV